MDSPHRTSAGSPGYETRDASATGVFKFLIAMGVILIAIGFACWGLFRYLSAHDVDRPATDSPFADTRQLPLGPQLQVNPRQDWLKFREDQQKSLETLAWVNRSAGTAQVPIEDAMEILVKKGLPVQGETQTPPATAKKQPAEGSKKP